MRSKNDHFIDETPTKKLGLVLHSKENIVFEVTYVRDGTLTRLSIAIEKRSLYLTRHPLKTRVGTAQ